MRYDLVMWLLLILGSKLYATEVYVCEYKFNGAYKCDMISEPVSEEDKKTSRRTYQDDYESETSSKYQDYDEDEESEESPLFK